MRPNTELMPGHDRTAAGRRLLALGLAALALGPIAPASAASGGSGASAGSSSTASSESRSPSSGGGGLAPTHTPSQSAPAAPAQGSKGRWIGGFTITEYWPAPEAWFDGQLVSAPGLPGKHRIDWLYSAQGMSMEGDGIGLDGRRYHIDSMGDGGWVTAAGQPTQASDDFSAGAPFWRAGGYWRNRSDGVTFPLERGGWSNGAGRSYVPLPGVSFASGPSLPLRYYQSIAVDPKLIPLGSRVYIPAYRNDGHGGWFLAQDTGGAINGHHVDVYRTPPASPNDGGQYLTSQRVYVINAR